MTDIGAGHVAAAPRGAPATAQGAAARPALPVLVLLYLLAVTVPVAFQLGPLYLTGLRLFLLLTTVPLTVRLFMGHYGRIVVTDWLFLLHVGWVGLTIGYHHGGQTVQFTGIYGIEFYGGYVLARATIRGPEAFTALVRTVVVIIFCLLPLAFYEAGTGRPPVIDFIRGLPGLLTVEIVDIDVRMGLERSQVVFAHPIHFGLFCSSVFSLCYVGLKGEVATFWRLVFTVASGLGAFLALSSGALLAVVMHLALIGWAAVLGGVAARWKILLGLMTVGYVAVDLASNRTPFDVFLTYATFNSGTAYWRSLILEYGLQNVNRSPILGIGLNDWIRPWWMFTSSVDNFWLLTAMRHGYPGFLTLAGGYVWMLWRVGRLDFDADARLWRYRRAWMFTFCGLTFTLCTVHIWTSVFSYTFFLFGAGIWLLGAEPRAGTRAEADGPAEEAPTMGSRYARFSGEGPAPRRPSAPVFARRASTTEGVGRDGASAGAPGAASPHEGARAGRAGAAAAATRRGREPGRAARGRALPHSRGAAGPDGRGRG